MRGTTFRRLWTFAIDRTLLLVVGAVVGLAWANLAHDSYERLAHALHFTVNDIGMAFFFALAAKEVVEATKSGGALHSPRRAAVPLVAALGGMVGPALIFVALSIVLGVPELLRGWAVPCATDIAFSYLVARVIFGANHPGIPFLLLLAIADDALGLLILAIFYPSGQLHPLEFVVVLGVALCVAAWLRRRRTINFWSYIVGAGVLSWFAFYRGGLHPALALVPIIPFLPQTERDAGLFVESPSAHDTLNEFEHWWKMPVQMILFFFGLVNSGVEVTSAGAGTWVVLAAILFGKPIGIVSATALSMMMGLHRPTGVTWRDLIVLGITAGIGFTVALFFATAAFPGGGYLLDQTKMGALLSFSAAGLALATARLFRVGRFANSQNRTHQRRD